MSNPSTPSTPPSSGDDRNLVQAQPAVPGFEERLQAFWSKNSKAILIVCAVVLLVIVGRGAVELLAAGKERSIASAYASATNNDQLKGFIAAHPGHALSGIAHLRLADEAFTAGRFIEARGDYEKAAAVLKTGPFAGRVRVGVALSKFNAGDTAGAEADLRAVADDVTQLKAVRGEAAYHLASLAATAGRTDEVTRLTEQVMTVDPTGMWSQRAMMLRATQPASAVPAAPVAPASSGDAVPSIQFNTGN